LTPAGRRRLLGAGLALVAAAGHFYYWYGARPRTGSPQLPEARQLLADPVWDLVVWNPYPHQNLGALEQRVGDVEAWAALLATSGGKKPPRLPRFGPWGIPPATEWVVALREGGALRAAARVYPVVALVARAAGTVAGNPWLAGGEVALGEGRRARVAWRGLTWTLATEDGLPEASGGLVGDLPPALAWIRLSRPPFPLPTGLWALRAEGQGVVAELGAIATPRIRGPGGRAGGEGAPAAWIAEVAPEPIGGPSALIFWEKGGAVEGLPSAALLGAGAAQPYKIPGMALARLAGLGGERLEVDGIRVTALDAAGLERGAAAVPWLREMLPGAGGGSWRMFASGVDPEPAMRIFWRAARHLERLPVLGKKEAQRLDAIANLLAPWTDCDELVLEVWRDPDAARVAICTERSAAWINRGRGVAAVPAGD